MDVLNLSDPNSDLFDNEEYNIQKEIEQLSLSVSKRAAVISLFFLKSSKSNSPFFGCFFDTFFPTFLLFFLSLFLFSSVCPITVFNGSALDSFTGGALDSFVLNLSDPNSDLFDNEEYIIQKEIEQLSLSVSKRAAEKDRELRELYATPFLNETPQDELFQARCYFFGNQCGNDMSLKHEKLFLLNNQ
jgi:hypothetical protein